MDVSAFLAMCENTKHVFGELRRHGVRFGGERRREDDCKIDIQLFHASPHQMRSVWERLPSHVGAGVRSGSRSRQRIIRCPVRGHSSASLARALDFDESTQTIRLETRLLLAAGGHMLRAGVGRLNSRSLLQFARNYFISPLPSATLVHAQTLCI